MENGTRSATDAVEREKEAWERDCCEAQEKLDAAHKKQQEGIDRLGREIKEAQANLVKVKRYNEKYASYERAKCSATPQGRWGRAEPRTQKGVEDAGARNKRNNIWGTFFSNVGDATAAVDSALQDLRNAERKVDRLSREADRLEDCISDQWWRIDLEAEWLAKRNA
ncbi:hypothetical protein F4803DRAFT_196831 [Xylaria telfairii]|nr:hypothetical protein F4803DRAFT_196831 [Xylaria telfairii]